MKAEIRVADADPGEEVEVVELNVEVGAEVKEGEALMEIASDKANMDLTAPIDGVRHRAHRQAVRRRQSRPRLRDRQR